MNAAPAPPAEIADQLAGARAVLDRHLAPGSVRAIHLFGSAIDGGLRKFSDIDLLVTVDAPLAGPARRALMLELLGVSAWPGSRLTLRALEVTLLVHGDVVPWRYPPRRELQFGEWLRQDLLAGRTEPPGPDPDLAILLTQVRQRSACLQGTPAPDLFDAVPASDFRRALSDTVAPWKQPDDWRGDERNVVLTLARIWYSASTGAIASKDEAAAWALERLPARHRAVLEQARAAYLGTEDEDRLAGDPIPVAAFVHRLQAEIRRALSPAPSR